MHSPWKTLASRLVYENAWIRVREDRIERPHHGEGIYGVVEIRPSVGVVALDARDQVVLVGQWRYPHGKYSWEIPRGGSHDGETDMQAVAARELREEAGVEAAHWTPLGGVDVCNGVTTDTQSLYLATELALCAARPDPEEDIAVRWMPFRQAVEWSLSGEIAECCSVAALLRVEALRRTMSPQLQYPRR
ncbi:MAG TPA: NUDIX hydrolase [Bryobacteraceae bacterium]|nr:NUDIX hydrolase [Bryobacteraceae bacterium]